MKFNIPAQIGQTFTVNIADFEKFTVSFKNANGDLFDFDYYCLKNSIILQPIETIPSFYMVDKNGVVYDGVEYVLVPYIRFMIPDPSIRYDLNTRNFDGVGEMHRTDYRQNLFHPYWVGGVSVNGQGVPYPGLPNPNTNSYENITKLMDLYLTPTDFNSSGNTTHGFRNSKTQIKELNPYVLGQDLVENQGSFGDGIFMPGIKRFLQASAIADSDSPINNHLLKLQVGAGLNNRSATFYYAMGLPETSVDVGTPYILPPMYLDLFSIYHRVQGTSNGSAGRYQYDNNSGASCAVLTFGIQPK